MMIDFKRRMKNKIDLAMDRLYYKFILIFI